MGAFPGNEADWRANGRKECEVKGVSPYRSQVWVPKAMRGIVWEGGVHWYLEK